MTNVVSFKDGSELVYLAKAVVNVVPVLGEVDGTEAEAVVAAFVVSFGEVDVGHGIDHDAVGLQGVGALRVFLVEDGEHGERIYICDTAAIGIVFQMADVALKVIVNPINKRLLIVSVLEKFLGKLLVEWYPSERHMNEGILTNYLVRS